jgi:hypothetical protein
MQSPPRSAGRRELMQSPPRSAGRRALNQVSSALRGWGPPPGAIQVVNSATMLPSLSSRRRYESSRPGRPLPG